MNVASTLVEQGRGPEALETLREAQRIWRGARPVQRRPLSGSLGLSVDVLLDRKEHDAALPLATEALSLLREEYGNQGEPLARGLQRYARLQLALGHRREAADALAEAHRLATTASPADTAWIGELNAQIVQASRDPMPGAAVPDSGAHDR